MREDDDSPSTLSINMRNNAATWKGVLYTPFAPLPHSGRKSASCCRAIISARSMSVEIPMREEASSFIV